MEDRSSSSPKTMPRSIPPCSVISAKVSDLDMSQSLEIPTMGGIRKFGEINDAILFPIFVPLDNIFSSGVG
jgi:hypothetical protein